MYDFNVGGIIIGALVAILSLIVALLGVLGLWLFGVRPDWWMLWPAAFIVWTLAVVWLTLHLNKK